MMIGPTARVLGGQGRPHILTTGHATATMTVMTAVTAVTAATAAIA